MASKKFYAVAVGRVPGLYSVWEQARRQVDGFAGARFKGFSSRGEAEAWLADPELRRISAVRAAPSGRAETTSGSGDRGVIGPEVGQVTASRGKVGSGGAGRPAAAVGPDLSAAPGPGEVVIYTDGGAINNPGPGGYGVVQLYDDQRRELAGGFRLTTNNRMELMACIVALRELEQRDKPVRLYSDSSYVVNGINKGWAKNWRRRGWIKADRQPALNPDLWGELLDLVAGLQVSFHWVRGHAGNPLNERCDQLAVAMARSSGLPVDEGYE